MALTYLRVIKINQKTLCFQRLKIVGNIQKNEKYENFVLSTNFALGSTVVLKREFTVLPSPAMKIG